MINILLWIALASIFLGIIASIARKKK